VFPVQAASTYEESSSERIFQETFAFLKRVLRLETLGMPQENAGNASRRTAENPENGQEGHGNFATRRQPAFQDHSLQQDLSII